LHEVFGILYLLVTPFIKYLAQ